MFALMRVHRSNDPGRDSFVVEAGGFTGLNQSFQCQSSFEGSPMPARDVSTRSTRSRHVAALSGSVSMLALLLLAAPVQARPLGQAGAANTAAATATNAALAGAAQAAAAAVQAQRSINNAARLIRQQLNGQLAARNAALAGPSSVPNGLDPSGLAPKDPSTWLGLNAPTQSQDGSQTTVTVKQTASSAIAYWSKFNIGRDTTLYFDQSGGNTASGNAWSVLNHVTDAAPSQVLGRIKAEGMVLVINQNGIVFGGSSQINVGSLVASTLNITDPQYLAGIVNQQAFNVATGLANPAIFFNASGTTGSITVEAGAMIETAPPTTVTSGGGSVWLFGANVYNNGTIYAPDGQVMLAAGTAAYVTASIDPNVRGVQVLVDNGGEARNTGYIGAPTGNISMTGMLVNQQGVLAASTSVNEAGSITLFAGDGILTETSTDHTVHAKRAGTVELAAGSLTTVVPEEDGQTAAVGQPQTQSLIRVEGETVNVRGNSGDAAGASIWAPGARIALNASSNPLYLYAIDFNPGLITTGYLPDAGRVYVGDGVTIDVAGLKMVSLAAAQNAVDVNARGNELRDSPVQRDGVLAGKDVFVDVRDLITIAADRIYTPGGLLEVSGYLGLAQRNIDQRLTAGGSVSIFSTGDAIVRPGSFIDISGGSLAHQAGYVNTTIVLGADGRRYSIDSAPADMTYVGFCCQFVVNHSRWGVQEIYSTTAPIWEPAYIEGTAAGSISLVVRSAEFDATVNAATVSGFYQRTLQTQPAGGTLTIGSVTQAIAPANVVIAPDVPAPVDTFANSTATGTFRDISPATSLNRKRDTPLSADRQQTLYLSADLLSQADYGTISINALAPPNGSPNKLGGISVTEGAELQVAPGGAINFYTPGTITIDGGLIARAGSVNLTTVLNATNGPILGLDIILDSGAVIDTRGVWVNDALDRDDTVPALINGGNVSIMAGGNVGVGEGSVIDASSGGWVQSNGQMKSSNGLPLGNGGDITLIADAFVKANTFSQNPTAGTVSNVPTVYSHKVTLDGTLRSHGFTKGGTLSITTRRIQIGGAPASDALNLDPGFFASGGFGRYMLYGYQGITIADGTDIELHATNFAVTPAGAALVATGTDVASFAPPTLTPAYLQAPPVDLILSAIDPFAGDLVMGKGSIINADIGATIALHATHQLTVHGTISAPAGSINLDLFGAPAPSRPGVPPVDSSSQLTAAPDFDPRQTLWIASDARLLAQGVIQSYVDGKGRITNVIRDGGSVNINQDTLDALYYSYPLSERSVNAPLGTVVSEAGAVIDVSGAAGTIAVPSLNAFHPGASSLSVATNGGAINIRASQGLLWSATMNAHSGSSAAAGGSLSIDQVGWGQASSSTSRLLEPDYVVPIFELIISQMSADMAPGLKLGDAVPAALQGKLFIGVDQIEASGATSVSLGAVDAVVFNGNVTLGAASRLTLNARNFSATPGATVTLNAPYVDIGGGQRFNDIVGPSIIGSQLGGTNSGNSTPVAGTAKLIINANLIDIEGDLRSGAAYSYTSRYNGTAAVTTAVNLPGFASMSFNSTGDIRLITQQAASGAKNQILTLGDLNFTAAQVYPNTTAPLAGGGAPFTISAKGPTSVINFFRNSAVTPPTPMSAGGQLIVIAPTINQGGVVRAPMGQITFGDSTNPSFSTVNLLPGSITSVSLDGALVPYGQPEGDLGYIYGYTGVTATTSGAPNELSTPPSKQISIYGSTVNVAGASGGKAAAVIDESGGGDLYGAQFVSGRTGSVDTLAGAQTFAIVPSLGTAYAPRDPQMQRADGGLNTNGTPVNLKVGDQVYLSGIPGLAAGYYTLLPGHYALLPGGFKVTVAQSNVAPSQLHTGAVAGGGYIVGGYRANGNTGQRDQLGSEFMVTSGDVVRTRSQYDETTVSQFFASQAASRNVTPPQLAQDAGRLLLQVTNTLIFQGRGDFSVGEGGRGGQADIIGTKLAILGDGDVAPTGFIGLTADALNAIGAQSLLIGGTRSTSFAAGSENNVTITPVSQQVEIEGHAQLIGPEIMVVASDKVTLDSGAVIDTTSSAALPNQFPVDPATGLSLGQIVLGGSSGAFLMASNAMPVSVTRSTVAASTSTLVIGAGAGVFARSSLILNDSNTMSIDPTARFAAPTVNVGANVVNVGSGATSGFTITNELLALLSRGDASRGIGPTTNLILSAAQSINLYGSASLGTFDPATGQYSVAGLTLNAPLIQGIGTAGDVAHIAASRLTLQGTATAGTGVAGSGGLQIESDNLTLGPGNMNLAGFGLVNLIGNATVAGNGTGLINVAGDLTVTTSRLTGNAKSDTTLSATGSVKLTRPKLASGTAASINSLGAHLTVTGQTIEQDTDIEIASGVVNLTGNSGVTLDAGSIINVAGGISTFFDVVRIAAGGTVNLTAKTGDVDIEGEKTITDGKNTKVIEAAIIDVSGTALPTTDGIDPLSSDAGGDAGTLNIAASSGTAILDGTFKTGSVAGYKGAQLSLDLGFADASGFSGVQGFSEKQALTLRSGDLLVGNVTAHDVELSATSGNVLVLGVIDATGANGGVIRLSAGLGKTLAVSGTAVLDAHATSADGDGGNVFLGVGISDTNTAGRVVLGAGAKIDVSGNDGGGKVVIRAPRVGNDGVGVMVVNETSDHKVVVAGAREVDVEAVAVSDITANPFVDQALVAADAAAQAYMANASIIKSSLGSLSGIDNFHLMPGIELRSTGDITLMQNPTSANPGIDLHNLRYGGEVAVLTLRAAGNLIINGSLSDGFFGPVTQNGPDPITGGTNGAVYALAAMLPAGSRSWSLQLVAGADLSGGDPLGVLPSSSLASGKGSLIFNDPRTDQKGYPIPSVVRTGTGDLDLAAGRDISLLSQFGIYTAGTQSAAVAGFTPPTRPFIPLTQGSAAANGPNSILGYFTANTTVDTPNKKYDSIYQAANTPFYPEHGGTLTVSAKGNLSGAALPLPTGATNLTPLFAGSELETFWLWTQETPGAASLITNPTWYINFGAYYQAYTGGGNSNLPALGSPRVAAFVGLGALGGGGADVRVGGNMTNVDVVVPTTGRVPGRDLTGLVVTGGGVLDVDVGGTLNNANLLIGRGVARIRAADIGSAAAVTLSPGDAQIFAYADRNINVLVGDPTRPSSNATNGVTPIGLDGITNQNFRNGVAASTPFGYFTTYSANTAFNTFAAGGDVTLSGSYVPPIMEVVAPSGSIFAVAQALGFGAGGIANMAAVASPNAQLDFLAGQSIKNVGVSMTGANLVPDPSTIASVTYAVPGTLLNFAANISSNVAPNIVQFDDPRTIHIYAVAGDLVGPDFSTTKRTAVRAGRDIIAPVLYLQNSDRDPNTGDVSSLIAGRDLTSQVTAGPSGNQVFNVRLGGPGYLEVQAGRNLLVTSNTNPTSNSRGAGIATIGNADNILLPRTGATIGVMAGVGAAGADNAAFINAYLDPSTARESVDVLAQYTVDLVSYVIRHNGKIKLDITQEDFDKLSPAQQALLLAQQALKDFRALSPIAQAPLIQQVYFAEIRAGGEAAVNGNGSNGRGYDRGYAAIQTLFPGSVIGGETTAYHGDISLYANARIRTEGGGDINLLAPGGDIILGFENQVPNLAGQKDTARPGLLTLRGGEINTFSDGDVIVAQSRIFTELGGDIVMWSTNGDLNAGKGKKTSLVTSPPQFTLDPFAHVTKAPSTPQTGAGIAALQGVPGIKQGDVDLFAPHGTVDAGDAGVRAHDVHVGAQFVLNADNIQASGKAVGIPTAPPPPVSALLAADNTAAAVSKLTDTGKSNDNQDKASLIIVEVLGYGGGCSGDPAECQKQ
jgi:filamentous hemagglutinin